MAVGELLKVMEITDIFKVKAEGHTALHMAMHSGNNNIVKQLLEKYPDKAPELAGVQDVYGQTALHWAAAKRNEEAVTLLLQTMKPEDVTDKVTKKDNYTALNMALHIDDTHAYNHNIVEEILAKFPKLASLEDKQGQTPLHWAASNGIAAAVTHLLDILTDLDVSKKSLDGKTAINFAKSEDIEQLLELGSLKDYELIGELPQNEVNTE